MLLKIWSMLLLQHYSKPEYLVCQLNNGTSGPKAICPDTTLNFICNIEAQQLGFTKWLLPNGTCANIDRMVLLQPKYSGCNPSSNSQHGTCGPFTAQNVASSGCVNSSLSVVATQRLNGTEIRCMNYDGMSLFPIGNATISISVEGSNCAERSSATIDMWTLPSPPQNIHAYHVVSTPSTVYLQVTWTPVVGNNKLTYVMRVSSKDDLILNQVLVSSDHCDTTMCQFTVDFNATDTSVFFISIATISDSRIGPHSDEVKSVLAFYRSEPNNYSTDGVQTILRSTSLDAKDTSLHTCMEDVKCLEDSADVPDARVKALYSSLYNTSKQQHVECATNAIEGDQHSDARSEREIEQTSAQDSRCSDEDTDTRSVSQASESDQPDDYRLSSGYHCIPLEILPLQAEAPLDSDTWESGREEEDPSFEGDAYEFLDHVPLIYRTCLDTLYTITYEASNCAGRNETVIKSWTLPSPPQDIHATHVINITMQSMHLVVTWTSQLHADNNSYYILNVSSEDGLIFSVPQISMNHCENESSSCYFAQDVINVTFAKYFVSMASVSGLRTGPFSDQVESLGRKGQSV
eukprot:Em0005g534a